MGSDFKEGFKVQRATCQLQGMACHSRGQVGVEIADVLETYASFRELILQGIRSRLALKVEGLARVSKNAGGRPRLASVAFDGRYMGLAL